MNGINRFNRIQNMLANQAIRRARVFLDRSNPLEFYDDDQLYQRFRFHREGIVWLVELLTPQLQSLTARNRAIPPVIKICITLSFYATGNFQICVGDSLEYQISDSVGVTQSSVSRIIAHVTSCIKTIANDYIKYPETEEEINRAKQGFMELGGMPNIVGAIDGTHVRIQAPTIDEFAYVNRKNYHSINVQAIGTADCLFTNVIAKYPGSVHDSRILTESRIYEDLEAGRKSGVLLGDAGYMSKPYLLTPYDRTGTPAQTQYNTIHSRHRVKIEQLFGRWKRRFHCLHAELRVSPKKACDIIIACAVLHNEATRRNMEPFEDILIDEQPDIQPHIGQNQHGNQLREYYTNYFAGIQ